MENSTRTRTIKRDLKMPIYEFRCLKCGDVFEILFKSASDEQKLVCPKCESEELERVLSRTNYVMGMKSRPKPKITTKSCGGGTCATIDIPGPSE